MAHSLSAKKRIRQNEKKRMVNKSLVSQLKTQVRKFTEAIASKDMELAEAQYRVLAESIDRKSTKGLMHKNNAARRKSHLQTQLNTMKAAK